MIENQVKAKEIIKDKRGGGLMEYAILIGLIAIVVMAAIKVFGSTLQAKVNDQKDKIGSITG